MRGDKVLRLAKGFRGRAKNCVRIARERVEKALQYATRDRRARKRDARSVWIARIGAGAREHGVSFFLEAAVFCFGGENGESAPAAAAVFSRLFLPHHPRPPFPANTTKLS
jgi:hypothetical protein